jgi:hypothetical protein
VKLESAQQLVQFSDLHFAFIAQHPHQFLGTGLSLAGCDLLAKLLEVDSPIGTYSLEIRSGKQVLDGLGGKLVFVAQVR